MVVFFLALLCYSARSALPRYFKLLGPRPREYAICAAPRLVGSLVDWLAGWLVSWMVGCYVGRLVVGWLISWLVGWLVA